jgi:hypothetical protein
MMASTKPMKENAVYTSLGYIVAEFERRCDRDERGKRELITYNRKTGPIWNVPNAVPQPTRVQWLTVRIVATGY